MDLYQNNAASEFMESDIGAMPKFIHTKKLAFPLDKPAAHNSTQMAVDLSTGRPKFFNNNLRADTELEESPMQVRHNIRNVNNLTTSCHPPTNFLSLTGPRKSNSK